MLSGGMLEAGTDTTANELRAAVAAFSTHPEVVKRAQQELQDVLGNDPPSLEDIDKLEYVRCIVKEVLRWCVYFYSLRDREVCLFWNIGELSHRTLQSIGRSQRKESATLSYQQERMYDCISSLPVSLLIEG